MLHVLGEPLPPSLGPLDRFEIMSRLGRGSHGVVYDALDRQQGVRVALKTLRFADANNLLRLKREFRELVSLHHPNLVKLGELFEDDGRWFFSMQLVRGVDWTSYIHGLEQDLTITASHSIGVRRCDIARLRGALVQLGHGLHALHEADKLHRDIKPSNIRVEPNGRLLLLDFGLVAPLLDNASHEPADAAGTVAYMAPEQAGFVPLTAASDCYAVGILMYEALIGELPFKGSMLEIIAAKQSGPVRIPAERAASLPADLVELCHDLCQLDPARRPSAAEIAARAQPALPSPVAAPPRASQRARTRYAGREAELGVLNAAIERVQARELAHVRVYGEPGIGKSSLLAAWTESLEARRDLLLLSGRCHERERVPYKALDAVIDALGEHVSRLTSEECAALVPRHAAALAYVFPVLDRLCSPEYGLSSAHLPQDPIVLRAQAYGALRELLRHLCRRSPVVLVLDDFQWSDAESLDLLGAVLEGPTPPPLALITASWPLARCSPWLQDSCARVLPAGREIELGALPDTAARALVEQVVAREGGQLDAASVSRLAADSGNHPLFIELLARAAARGAAGHASLEQALEAELARHTPQARALLQLAALAGAPLSVSALSRAAQLGVDACRTALDELRAAGLLVLHDEGAAPLVAIYHAQIRDNVRARLDAPALRAHHRALAEALAQEETRDYEALALHWEGALCLREAALCFVQAAEHAERARAFSHAAALYEHALRCVEGRQPVEERCRWLSQLGAAFASAARCAEAAHTFLLAANLCSSEEARLARRAAASNFLSAGDTTRGLEIASGLLSELGQKLPRTAAGALASMAWQRARVGWGMRDVREQVGRRARDKELACDLLFELSATLSMLDLPRSADLHARSLCLALSLGDPYRMARALAGEALYGNFKTAAAELRGHGIMARAEQLAQRIGEPYLIGWVKLCSATRHWMGGEHTLALTDADAALELFEGQCRNVAWQIGSAYACSLSALTGLGRFDELERRYDAALSAAQSRGNIASFVTLVATNRCTVDLVADRPRQCRASIDEVTRGWPAERELQHTCALCANLLIDLYLGGDLAHRRVESVWPRVSRQLIFHNGRIAILLRFARGTAALAALAADGCEAHKRLRIARACAADLLQQSPRDARASGHLQLAQLATWQGRLADAVRHYGLAAGLWEGVGVYLAHIARQRMGELSGGPEGAALIAGAQDWARAQRIVNVERFFATAAPIDASMLGRHVR